MANGHEHPPPRLCALVRARRAVPPHLAPWAAAFPNPPALPPGTASLPALRPYQAEVARAILASLRIGAGLSFSVMISRQGAKNELSALPELLLLNEHRRQEAAA